MNANPYYPHICRLCAFWKSSGGKARSDGKGVKGYCHRHYLVSHDSGHCASFVERDARVAKLEAAE